MFCFFCVFFSFLFFFFHFFSVKINKINKVLTCDESERGIREIFVPFQGEFRKLYRIYRKIPDSVQGDFEFFHILEQFLPILGLISWSLPDDEGGITCMKDLVKNLFE